MSDSVGDISGQNKIIVCLELLPVDKNLLAKYKVLAKNKEIFFTMTGEFYFLPILNWLNLKLK